MSNPFAALISAPSRHSNQDQKTSICEEIENCFGFTLNKSTSRKKRLVYLEEQVAAFPQREIDLEILEHALFERLFLQNASEDKYSTPVGVYRHIDESKVINYLNSCFENVNKSMNEKFRKIALSLIMRNILTTLKQPDLFEGQNIYQQFYDVLKNEESRNIFDAILKTFLQDDDGFDDIYEVYTKLLIVIHVDVAKATILQLNPVIFHILNFFTIHEQLGMIFMDYSSPKKAGVGIEYANTLLGALFSVSPLPKTANGKYDFFQTPLDRISNMSTESLLHSRINMLTQQIHSLILNLIKCNGKVRSKILSWFGDCLKTNADRGKLWNTHAAEFNPANYTNVSDGFMINMGYVLMRLCQPFCTPDNMQKILKVDPTYCAVSDEDCPSKEIHLLEMSKQTCFIPVSDLDNTRLVSTSYSFVTECFYMGHRALDLGFRVIVEKLVRLNQDMVRIERAYNDAINQPGVSNDLVETMKQRMTSELAKYLSIKVSLSEPALIEMIFHFVSSSTYWLAQVAVHENSSNNLYAPQNHIEITFPIGDIIPDTLKCIPEFIIENIVSFLIYLRRFDPKVFEIQGFDNLQHILTFILVYMGSPQRMKNPHMRACLADALEALLPFHKDEPAGLNTLGGYQREKLFNEHVHRKEIVRNLLDVFVGIEMTGQSVQFEQKFNYRRPMYFVMNYLWELPEHQHYFQLLAEEAEANMEAVTPPLFLRFVNLLMNDAVFLLDEALSNMSKLKEMETARENGEWNQLSPTERAQNLAHMQQTGILARFDNILGRDTIKALRMLTSKITIVFTHTTMVERVAAMLNYFLLNLVGPKQKNFKVKDQKEYNFKPAATVYDICQIYVNLKESSSFCLAVSQDGRSYSRNLFKLAEDVLIKIGCGVLVGELQEVADKVSQRALELDAHEELTAEAPDHFLDPIMSTIMCDPVILPSSKQIVDRTTIARHLLSDQTDPFNRSPLTMDQVIPNRELAEEIRQWIETKKKK